MTKIFELREKLDEIKKYIETNANDGKIDEILLSLIERQNDLLGKIIDKIEEVSTLAELEEKEDEPLTE